MTSVVPLIEVSERHRGGAISIGNFDGVHRGHRGLLAMNRAAADRVGGPAVAMVLDPHPATILRPDVAPPRLTSIARRAELLGPLEIDYLVVCPVDTQFLQLSATEFFAELIVARLGSRAVVEGPNFFFGRDRGGNVTLLRRLCRDAGIEFQVAEAAQAHPAQSGSAESASTGAASTGSTMISSSRIRDLLAAGQFAAASEMLTAPYRISGEVIAGQQRGRQIGFPTANLGNVDVLVPADGVYGGRVVIATPDDYGSAAAGGQTISADAGEIAAIHIGPNPTFGDESERKIEVHLLDFDGDLYGKTLLVDFHVRVRDIARFDSVDRLVSQLQADVEFVREKLSISAD